MRPSGLRATLGILAGAATVISGCVSRRPVTPMGADPAIRFRDVTSSAGLRCMRVNGAFGKKWLPETMGGGGAFLDYDRDGRLDILFVKGGFWPGHVPPGANQSTLVLYRNNGNGTFTDVTGQAGLQTSIYGMGVAVGDYDNDGFDDLFVTAVGRSRLFHNVPDERGQRKFVDVTDSSRIDDIGWSTSAAWVDYDRDGKLDLFVCHYVRWSPETDIFCGTTDKVYCRPLEYVGESCRLYRNLGSGHFADVTGSAGLLNPHSKALAVYVSDVDGNGFPDLIVANDMEPTAVYRNNGNRTFTDVALQTGMAYDSSGNARAGMGIDAADYKNDGSLGVAIGDFNFEGIAFYHVAGPPPYEDRSKMSGVFDASYPYVTFGVLFADFDNDGWPDLFATNGDIEDAIATAFPGRTYRQPSLLLRNRGDGRFVDVSAQAGPGVTEPLVGRGLCRGDYDNDGKEDILLIPNVDSPRLLHNETPTNRNWLTIGLVGHKSNRNGIGAIIRLGAGSRTMSDQVRSGSSYLSASDVRLHFGLGDAKQADWLEIRWPSGVIDRFGTAKANHILIIEEGQAATGRTDARGRLD